MTYSAWTGKTGQYHWVQSSARVASEILFEVPDLVVGKFVVVSTFDGCSLIEEMHNPNDERWSEIGAPRIIGSLKEIRWTGNGEEIFVFSQRPKDETLQLIGDSPMVEQIRADDSTIREVSNFWQMLTQVAPESFFGEGMWFFFCTTDESLFDTVMNCNTIRELPQRRQQELQRQHESLLESLGAESGPENCIHPNCTKLRIQLGINCRQHHLQMLGATREQFDQ